MTGQAQKNPKLSSKSTSFSSSGWRNPLNYNWPMGRCLSI